MPYVTIQVRNLALNIDRLAATVARGPAPGEAMSHWDKLIHPVGYISFRTPDPAATRARLLAEGWTEDELGPGIVAF